MKRSRFLFVIMLIFLGLILVGCDLSENGNELGENEVKVKNSESTFVGTYYEDVVEKLQDWGFTNIMTEPIYDIVWGITQEGSTKSVSIDGSNVFKNGDIFEKNVLVVVTYSMRVSDDPAKQKYEITWKNEDGTTLRTDQVLIGTTPVYNGNEPKKPATNEKKYIFNGWTPEIEAVNSNKTYTATYLEVDNLLTITFDLDGGVWDLDNSQSVIYDGLITNTIPTKDGFDFVGWVIKGFFFDTEFDSATKIKEDYTLTAKWTITKHTVLYDLDGGTWSRSDEQTLNHNNLITTTKPTKDGHEFVGWLLNNEIFDVSTPITSDLNLKAQWYLPNYEDILVGRWETRDAGMEGKGFSFLEFDGYFYDVDGERKSGVRDFNYNWGSFTLYGNRIGFYFVDVGMVYFTLSYSDDKLYMKNINYLDIVMYRTENEPNSLAWKWNNLYQYAKTQSIAKSDLNGTYYEIETNVSRSNLTPTNKQVISIRQVLKVYQNGGIKIQNYYVGINDPSIEMVINISFNYSLISNNILSSAFISIESEGYTMFTNHNNILIEFDEQANAFFFITSDIDDYYNNFPTTHNNIIGDLTYFSQTLLFDISDTLIREQSIYMFTK